MKTLLAKKWRNLPQAELLAALPVVFYFTFFFIYSVNAPQFDDFQTAVRAVVTFDYYHNHLQWLLEQYGEHRIAYVRLVSVALQRILGHINFVWLGLIGNVSLIGVVIIFFKWFRKWKLERYFLPVPFILLHMNYHHNTFTAMMALQNLSILFWALITFWWVANARGWRIWAALFSSVLAVYTSGNGLFVVLVSIFLLSYRRQWLHVAIWTLVGGGAVVAYFWDLNSVRPNYNLAFLIEQAPYITAFTVFFSGSYFDLLPNLLLSSVQASAPFYKKAALGFRLLLPFIAGLVLISGSLVLTGRIFISDSVLKRWQYVKGINWLATRFTYFRKPTLFMIATILFVLLTAGVVALGRIDGGLSQSFAIRYKIYSPLLLICCYAVFLVNIRNHKHRDNIYYTVLLISLFVGLNSYIQNLNQIQSNKRTAVNGQYNMVMSKSWAVYGSYYGNIDSLIQSAIDRKVYQIHTPVYIHSVRAIHKLKEAYPSIDIQFDTTTLMAHFRVMKSQLALSLLNTNTDEGAYFLLYNKQREYMFPAKIDVDLLGSYQSSFECHIERNSQILKQGLYQVAVMTSCRGKNQLYRTPHSITVAAHK